MEDLFRLGYYQDLKIDQLIIQYLLENECYCYFETYFQNEFQKKFANHPDHYDYVPQPSVIPLLKLQYSVSYFKFNFDLLNYQNSIVFSCHYFLQLFSVFEAASYNYYTERQAVNFDFSVQKYRLELSNFTLDYCHSWASYYFHLIKPNYLGLPYQNHYLWNLRDFIRKKYFLIASLINLIYCHRIGLMTFFQLFLLIGLRFDFAVVCKRFSCFD